MEQFDSSVLCSIQSGAKKLNHGTSVK